MKTFLTLTLSILIISSVSASTESEFIKEHIIAFHELNMTVQNFENKLLNIAKKDTALKYIDNYSLAIEKSLAVYSKYKQSNIDPIKEVATDLSKMLTDIMNNNYQLLGKLVKPDFDTTKLKTDCEELIKKNQYIANFLKDVSIGICMTTIKDKPKRAKSNEQFSKLTKTERDKINELLVDKFGATISKMKKEDAVTPFEYSCVAIYEFLNMTWIFEKD
jgi:hypothetical protein